ncbi:MULTISPECIES: DoxX family protein [Spirosoma]|uniref:DoxX family protein n=1 Tax=Spirosoma liriopis TaxID=2937440 RepID=A0ABT0HU98_9BACT|nr:MULTISPECIES: DoxX family protein [Spirosoma]MCK8495783.1 DoxX family protein [Spirosoma liriopis]UHG94796.1 DoxX family protein [Spirosoma oryzicola]
MKQLFATNPASITPLIARLALGIVVFPHGAQKLLGWFGGSGFEGTMGFLTGSAGLPWIVGLLVILIEFFGPLMLFLGAATRVAALGILGNFIGIVLTAHSSTGFFMNWGAEANKEEGIEYFILLFGLALIVLIAGGGKASVDAELAKNRY